jgi:hypothetical protein
MYALMRRPCVASLVLVVCSGIVTLAGCSAPPRSTGATPVASDTVSRAEAEALLSQAVDLAVKPGMRDFCAKIAASEQQCASEVSFATGAGWRPGPTPPHVVGTRNLPATSPGTSPIMILEVAGTRADGAAFTADFAAARTQPTNPESIRSLTPVFWAGTTYKECRGESATNTCTATAQPPISR